MNDNQLPGFTLVKKRCEELDLTPKPLINRCGYKNTAKGLRRLEHLLQGEFSGCAMLIEALPCALEIPIQAVLDALGNTTQQLRDAEEEAWRAAFKAHAVILTERKNLIRCTSHFSSASKTCYSLNLILREAP